MELEQLIAKKRELELIRDRLWDELVYVDQLMRQVGFSEGIETVKATAKELSIMQHFDGVEDEEAA